MCVYTVQAYLPSFCVYTPFKLISPHSVCIHRSNLSPLIISVYTIQTYLPSLYVYTVQDYLQFDCVNTHIITRDKLERTSVIIQNGQIYFAEGATYGQECNAVSNTCSDSNTDCYIEDCYKCRCQSGYTYNSGTGVCDQSCKNFNYLHAFVVVCWLFIQKLLWNVINYLQLHWNLFN